MLMKLVFKLSKYPIFIVVFYPGTFPVPVVFQGSVDNKIDSFESKFMLYHQL